MREFILIVFGFSLACYIFSLRYLAAKDIIDFLFCLDKMDEKKIFNYDIGLEIAKKTPFLTGERPNFDVDLSSVVFNSPGVLANEIFFRSLNLRQFLEDKYSPYDQYFITITELLSNFISRCEDPEVQAEFVTNFILCNYKIASILEALKYYEEWEEKNGVQKKKANEVKRVLKTLDESQLRNIACYCFSDAKGGVASLVSSMKDKYISSRTWYAVKNASLLIAILLSLHLILYFIWQIDLINILAELLSGIFEPNDY